MSSAPVSRPASVTLLVVLIWLNALLTLFAGGVLLFGASNASVVDQFNGNADAVRLAGWVLLLLGLLIALVAIGLSKGSNFLRIVLAIILLFRIGGDIWLILNANYDPAVWLSMAFNLFILYLLFNAKASAYFDQ